LGVWGYRWGSGSGLSLNEEYLAVTRLRPEVTALFIEISVLETPINVREETTRTSLTDFSKANP
jgi:hypothetical protein